MRALGYNVWLHKYLAFVISGAFAARRRVLAYYNGFVSPVDVQLVPRGDAGWSRSAARHAGGAGLGPPASCSQEFRERLHQAAAAHPGAV